MKIRTGFVSNSSSSSFLAVGVKLNLTFEDAHKLYSELYKEGIGGNLIHFEEDDKHWFGYPIYTWDDYEERVLTVKSKDIEEAKEKIEKLFNKKAQVIVGTRSC
jgi:hypothetical protein